MKLNRKKTAALTACILAGCLLLTGCANEKKRAKVVAGDTTSYSDILEDSGYYTGTTAQDIIQLPEDYDSLTIPADYLTVSDATVDGYIDDMVWNLNMTTDVTDRAAQEGDVVTIDYVGTIDGKEFEGGSATGYRVELGSGVMISDFEGQIIGKMPGDVFDVTVTFPDDYGSTQDSDGNDIDLSNKTAVFRTTLQNIAVANLTDEAVAAAFGTEYTLDDGSVVDTVEKARQYFAEYARYKAATTYLADYLLTNSTLKQDIPATILEHERDMEAAYLAGIAEQQDATVEEILDAGGYSDMDHYLADSEDYIQQDVTYCLIIQAIAEAQDLAVTDADIQAAYGTDTDTAIATYGKGFVAQQTLALKVMDWLVARAAK